MPERQDRIVRGLSSGSATAMPETAIDRVHCLVTSHAQACLTDLAASGCIPRHEANYVSGSGWTVVTIAVPTPPAEGHGFRLSACDLDCLEFLSIVAGPTPGEAIRNQMEERHIGAWGLVTVKRSLARLTKLESTGV